MLKMDKKASESTNANFKLSETLLVAKCFHIPLPLTKSLFHKIQITTPWISF